MTFGGDEISALVLDIGTGTTRAGYAGEDIPKAVFPTSYGYSPQTITDPMTGEERAEARLYLGEHVNVWKAGMEVTSPVTDALITDWAPIPSLISHALIHNLRCNTAEHPVLVTEAPWNTPANREKMAEIMFEEFKVPAFYIANSAVLSAFAAGKGTALVVDIGKSNASVVPVSDGFVLRKGISHSALPHLVQSTTYQLLTSANGTRPPISFTPHQLIASKTAVESNKPPIYVERDDRVPRTTDSWRAWAESKEVEEWLMGVSAVLEGGWDQQAANSRPPKHYEFPTGFNTLFGQERFIPAETYFAHTHLPVNTPPPFIHYSHNLQTLLSQTQSLTQKPVSASAPRPDPLPTLFTRTLGSIEPDVRPALLQNVVLVGGGSMLPGMAERVSWELMRLFPGHKVRIQSPGNPMEKRYASWLGGSVLASLGTFHQLWISAEEWQEHGRSVVAQRCK